MPYRIFAHHTKSMVRTGLKTLKSAHRVADRLDNQYGAASHTVQREPEPVAPTPPQELPQPEGEAANTVASSLSLANDHLNKGYQ